MDFSIFHDWIFIIFTLSNFCTSIGFNIPYVFLVPLGKSLQIAKPSYLLATIGIANTIGRIVLGYLADKPFVNRLLVYNICLTICGIGNYQNKIADHNKLINLCFQLSLSVLASALAVFCLDMASLMVYSVVFGFTIGAYVGLTSVILVDLLGLDKLTNAFGLLLLFQGIASLVGPPMAGWLFDITKSYVPAFVLAGAMIALSGVILFAIPPLQRRKQRLESEIRFDINSDACLAT